MTLIEAGDLLWQPQNPEKTQIYQFASHIKTRHGFDWHESMNSSGNGRWMLRIYFGQPYGTGTGLSVIKARSC